VSPSSQLSIREADQDSYYGLIAAAESYWRAFQTNGTKEYHPAALLPDMVMDTVAGDDVISPRTMSVRDYALYLDYCSELLSLTSKAAALCAEESTDALVLDFVRAPQNPRLRPHWSLVDIRETIHACMLRCPCCVYLSRRPLLCRSPSHPPPPQLCVSFVVVDGSPSVPNCRCGFRLVVGHDLELCRMPQGA
jgi:hypothetical protein